MTEKNKGGRPRSASPKSTSLFIRVTPEQLALIDVAAAQTGLDRSKFIRGCVLSQAAQITKKRRKDD